MTWDDYLKYWQKNDEVANPLAVPVVPEILKGPKGNGEYFARRIYDMGDYISKPWLSQYGNIKQSYNMMTPWEKTLAPKVVIYPIKPKNVPENIQDLMRDDFGLAEKGNKIIATNENRGVWFPDENVSIVPYKQEPKKYGIRSNRGERNLSGKHEYVAHPNDPFFGHIRKFKEFPVDAGLVWLKDKYKEYGLPKYRFGDLLQYRNAGYEPVEILKEIWADSYAKGQIDYANGVNSEYAEFYKDNSGAGKYVGKPYTAEGPVPTEIQELSKSNSDIYIDPGKKIKSKLQDRYIYPRIKNLAEKHPDMASNITNMIWKTGKKAFPYLPYINNVVTGVAKGAIPLLLWEGAKKLAPEGQGDVLTAAENVVYSLPSIFNMTPEGISNGINSVPELIKAYNRYKNIENEKDKKNPGRAEARRKQEEMDREKQMWLGYR